MTPEMHSKWRDTSWQIESSPQKGNRDMSRTRVLSLGAGVQSSALFMLAVNRKIEPFHAAVFADTGWEPPSVYEQLRHLKEIGEQNGIEVRITTIGSIRDDTLAYRRPGKTTASDKPFISIPVYASLDGKKSMMKRQCTSDYKILPIRRELRKIMREVKASSVEMLIGISTDEAHRMRDSGRKYIINSYPLIDLRWRRSDCEKYLKECGLKAVKSACIGCPYKDDAAWAAMKRNNPEDFENAVEFDRAIRSSQRIKGEIFLHKSCVPLDQVLFNEEKYVQLDMFGEECEGMCGL